MSAGDHRSVRLTLSFSATRLGARMRPCPDKDKEPVLGNEVEDQAAAVGVVTRLVLVDGVVMVEVLCSHGLADRKVWGRF